MDHTLSGGSSHGNMDDYMMLCGQAVTERTGTALAEQDSRVFTSYESELANFVWDYSSLDSSRDIPTNGDNCWSKLPALSWPQSLERGDAEISHGSTSHHASDDESRFSKCHVFQPFPHNAIISASAARNRDTISPFELGACCSKATSGHQCNRRDDSPPRERNLALRPPQSGCDSQSLCAKSYPNLNSPSFLHSTNLPGSQAFAGYQLPGEPFPKKFEEHSDLSGEELDGEYQNELNQIEELEELHDPPYSQLIYRAIMSSPNKQMQVQEIYNWFKENTNKCGNPESTGWQNSIRHNLSMNAGFEAVKGSDPNKRVCTVWRISEKALVEGICSTTQYRKVLVRKRMVRSQPPSPRRQKSGAKGGRRSAITSKLRRLKEGQIAARSKAILEQTSRHLPKKTYLSLDHNTPEMKTVNNGMDSDHF